MYILFSMLFLLISTINGYSDNATFAVRGKGITGMNRNMR